jgi:hypothetical protein
MIASLIDDPLSSTARASRSGTVFAVTGCAESGCSYFGVSTDRVY